MFGVVHEGTGQDLDSREAATGTPEAITSRVQRGSGEYYQGTRIMRDATVMGSNKAMSGASNWQALCRNLDLCGTD